MLGWEEFGEEISEVVVGVHERDTERVSFHALADEEVTTLDVFGAFMVLGVVGQVACSSIVSGESERFVRGWGHIVSEGLKIHAVFGSFRERDDLGFGAGQSDGLLLLGAKEDGCALPTEQPTGGGVAGGPI